MPYSAAKSHHMVSELRLLISLNQDDPMGGMFDPDLPPIFDFHHDGNDSNLAALFCPELPPVFDVFHAENVVTQVLPVPCLNKSEGVVFIFEGFEEEDVLVVNFDAPPVFDGYDGHESQICRVESGCPESVWGFKEIGQKMIQGCGNFVQVTTMGCLNMQVCGWSQKQSSKVFNPGIGQQGKNAKQYHISRHLKAQESGRFFLKKGSMIRIWIRVNGGTNSLKVENQFNHSRYGYGYGSMEERIH